MIALGRVWKLYFIYTILLVVGVALAGFVLEAQVKKSLTEHLEEDALTLAKSDSAVRAGLGRLVRP